VQFTKSAAGGGGPLVFNSGGPRAGSGYAVEVTGLPRSASWQDLKDFLRPAGDIVRSDVDGYRSTGYVEFRSREDMEYAVRKVRSCIAIAVRKEGQ
jgi:hypothetical protein